jgi:hypothetical protein
VSPRPTKAAPTRRIPAKSSRARLALFALLALVTLAGTIRWYTTAGQRVAHRRGQDADDKGENDGTGSNRADSRKRKLSTDSAHPSSDDSDDRAHPHALADHRSPATSDAAKSIVRRDPAASDYPPSATASSRANSCSGYDCQVHTCPSGGSTTISGTVYDPAGHAPVYNVVAYVPSTAPDPIAPGVSCTTCADLYTGVPIASAVTDAAGNFLITGAPDGSNMPLVLQIGKWRRQLTIPSVPPCVNTALPDRTLTLPKNGSEGDLPQIAISTGSSDSIECLLNRIGVDRAEYVPGAGTVGHIHIFKGDDAAPDTSPPAPGAYRSLWDSAAHVTPYDMIILSCEGYLPAHPNPQLLFDYAAAGGRVLAEHSHYVWLSTGPFGAANLAEWTSGQHQGGLSLSATIVTTTTTGQPFARGQAFYEWLNRTGALFGGQLPIESPPSYNAYVTSKNPASQPWIVVNNSLGATLEFSFETPLQPGPVSPRAVGLPHPGQCGRVIFSDMHVGLVAGDYGSGRVTPAGCATGDLSPQEKAIEFALFDLASCVTPGSGAQEPPSN